jgi:hypothetical protein
MVGTRREQDPRRTHDDGGNCSWLEHRSSPFALFATEFIAAQSLSRTKFREHQSVDAENAEAGGARSRNERNSTNVDVAVIE